MSDEPPVGRPAITGYPVQLVVTGRRCVVVGAGPAPRAGSSCTRPSWYSISSSGTPLVSGITLSTQMSWPTMKIAKMLNPTPPPRAPTMGGKA